MCTTACNFIIEGSKFRLLLINLAWDYTQNELLVTFLVRNRTTDMISPVYNFLALNFYTQGFQWGMLLCLKIGSWKEMNRVIFSVNAFVFICIVFGLNFMGAKL